MPCAHIDTLVFEHGFCDGQTVTSVDVQQKNTARVQIRETVSFKVVPPNHIGATNFQIPQQNE